MKRKKKSDIYLNNDGEITNKEGDVLEVDPQKYYDIIDESNKYKKQAIVGFAVAVVGFGLAIISSIIPDKK